MVDYSIAVDWTFFTGLLYTNSAQTISFKLYVWRIANYSRLALASIRT